MRDWGILDDLRNRGTTVHCIEFRSYKDGQILHSVQTWPDLEKRFGVPHLLVHRGDILEVLLHEARRSGVALHTNSEVVDMDLQAVSVTTANNDTLAADMIIGADGVHSVCRSKILGYDDPPQPTGRLVYRFSLDPKILHADPELRHLVNPPKCTCWMGPQAHMVVYEIQQRDFFNVVVICPDPVPGRVQLGPRSADVEELRRFFLTWDPICTKLLDLAQSPPQYWTLLQRPPKNRVWQDDQAKRMVLMGDAAHAMTPHL
jgi:salicylate hydroxylase